MIELPVTSQCSLSQSTPLNSEIKLLEETDLYVYMHVHVHCILLYNVYVYMYMYMYMYMYT